MKLLDLIVEIERYISTRGLSHDDNINSLLEALSEDTEGEL